MNADWNWFFSSLSQSAAAIVGIFGAFIITKIFSNQTAFSEKSTQLKQYLIQAKKISDDANSCDIDWHNKHYNDPEYRKFADYLDGRFPANESIEVITDEIMEEFINNNSFSQYSEKEDIKKELMHIAMKLFESNLASREAEEAANEAESLIKNNPLVKHLGSADLLIGVRNYNDFINPKPQPILSSYEPIYKTNWEAVKRERENLEKSYLEAKHHSRLVADLLKSTDGNPESPRQISAALTLVLFIFFIGVIYPLSFMPAISAPEISFSIETLLQHIISFKGVLLGIITTAFTIIVMVFYTTNSRMKYSQQDLDELRKLTNAKNYCAHFKFTNDNDI
jgi:hypothetical protein